MYVRHKSYNPFDKIKNTLVYNIEAKISSILDAAVKVLGEKRERRDCLSAGVYDLSVWGSNRSAGIEKVDLNFEYASRILGRGPAMTFDCHHSNSC